ncbi:hypothetical protein [Streptomyces sp. NPDC052036]|uniref:hypothetical protein n=1 Tax=Streptomyces sp. NPDC052036 TaxID=3155171 RepID=UPI00341824D6
MLAAQLCAALLHGPVNRAYAQTEAALAATVRYRDLAQGASSADRNALRRAAYQQFAEVRRAAAHARREPKRPGRRIPDWEQAVTTADRLCGAVTARSPTADRDRRRAMRSAPENASSDAMRE